MSVKLTRGVVEKMAKGEVASDRDVIPVVQLTELERIKWKHNQEKYRLVLSDGIHTQPGLLVSSKNDLVKSGRLKIGSVIKLNNFFSSVIQGRRIVIVIDFEVIIEDFDIIVNRLRPAEPLHKTRAHKTGVTPEMKEVLNKFIAIQAETNELLAEANAINRSWLECMKENHILSVMSVDTSKMTPDSKRYWAAKRKNIYEDYERTTYPQKKNNMNYPGEGSGARATSQAHENASADVI